MISDLGLFMWALKLPIFFFRESGDALDQAAKGVTFLEMFKSRVDVALKDMVSGHYSAIDPMLHHECHEIHPLRMWST